MEINGTVYIHNNIRHQYHEILQYFNININTSYLNSSTEQPFQTILKPTYFLSTLQHQYQYQYLKLGSCNININKDIGKPSFAISIIKGVKLQYQQQLNINIICNISTSISSSSSVMVLAHSPALEYAKSFTTVWSGCEFIPI